MVNSVADLNLTKTRSRWAALKRLKKLWLSLAAMVVAALLVTAMVLRPVSPTDLGVGNRLLTSKVLSSWRDGNLIVLVRHEERCDR